MQIALAGHYRPRVLYIISLMGRGRRMSRNQRKRERRARESNAAIDDAKAIASIMAGNGIISKRMAKSRVMPRSCAMQTSKTKDAQAYKGVNHFLPALHHDSAVLIKGRTWVRNKPGRFKRDTMHDLPMSVD